MVETCNICGKRIQNKQALKIHKLWKHNEANPKANQEAIKHNEVNKKPTEKENELEKLKTNMKEKQPIKEGVNLIQPDKEVSGLTQEQYEELKSRLDKLGDSKEENKCGGCNSVISGKPRHCPNCDVELDWNNVK